MIVFSLKGDLHVLQISRLSLVNVLIRIARMTPMQQ